MDFEIDHDGLHPSCFARKIGTLGAAMKKYRLLMGMLAFGLVIVQRPAAAADILVGQAIAKSGWMEPYDHAARTADFAIEDLTARGGLLDRTIRSRVIDTRTDPDE